MARSRSSTHTLAILLLGAAVGWWVIRGDDPGTDLPAGSPGDVETRVASGGWQLPVLAEADVCGNAGYLCSGLNDAQSFRVLRFAADRGTLRVGVPAPAGVDPGIARSLQAAAIRGIQAWDGHPFPIRIVQRDRGEATDLDFRWTRSLEGRKLGESLAQLATGPGGAEYRSNGVTLVTHAPQSDRVRSTDEIRLTAAHEMGHALGLPHSDDPHDLMYPENTSTNPTSRDYRTLEALYALPLGAEVRR